MKKIILALLILVATSCHSVKSSSTAKLTEQIVERTIAPTTAVADVAEKSLGLRYEPGISIGIAHRDFSNRLQEIKEAGFKYIEITIGHSFGMMNMTDDEAKAVLQQRKSQVADAGLTLWSIHLPFEDKIWTNIAGSEEIRVQSVNNILRVLTLCAESFPECKNYVLHASKGTLSPRSESVKQARKSLEQMVPVANKLGVRLCVENLVGSLCPTIDEMEATIKDIDNVWVTYDIGHANCTGQDVVAFLEWIGTRLGTVHMHDTMFNSRVDDHRVVGQGNVNRWAEVYNTMLNTNRYRGVFLFELGGANAKEVMKSYEMIVDSYKNMFEK